MFPVFFLGGVLISENGKCLRFQSDKAYKQIFVSAVAILTGEKPAEFTLWKVDDVEATGYEVWTEGILLTESEFTRLVGSTPSACKVKPLDATRQMPNEEGKMGDMYLLSAGGIPFEVLNGLRRIRVFYRTYIQSQEHLLQPSDQIHPDQGQEVAAFNQKKAKEAMPSGLRASGYHLLPTLEEMQVKAEQAEARRVQKEKEKEVEVEPGEGAQTDSDVEVVPTTGISRRLQNRENIKADNKKKKDAKKAAKAKKGDDVAVELQDGEEGKLFESLDSDMQSVAQKCKQFPRSIPQWLFHLDVNRILQGEKLGRSICKASYLFFCENTQISN